eukprot:Phypoly_transcript_21331.p1 GENE.Phypoly_transcript_21331~~Phypoly_transcript_21331.p1  ORF type:complete len:133 (+),score=8.23 Phypoly_transcript_21331:57-455(+)
MASNSALVVMNAFEATDWLTDNFPMFLDALGGLTGAQIVRLTEAQIANAFEEGKPRPKPAMISAFYNQLHPEKHDIDTRKGKGRDNQSGDSGEGGIIDLFRFPQYPTVCLLDAIFGDIETRSRRRRNGYRHI